MGPDFHDNPLWSFSLRHYAQPGVKEACLALQDEHGLDVNVALACLWHERRGAAALSPEDIADLLARLATAQARVWNLRPLRRDAKAAPHGDALYKALKRAELLAENLLQRALFEALEHRPSAPASNGRTSLLAYATQQGKTLPPARVEAFLSA